MDTTRTILPLIEARLRYHGRVDLLQLVAELDELLESEGTADYCPNGLQVEGGADVRRIITGVSALAYNNNIKLGLLAQALGLLYEVGSANVEIGDYKRAETYLEQAYLHYSEGVPCSAENLLQLRCDLAEVRSLGQIQDHVIARGRHVFHTLLMRSQAGGVHIQPAQIADPAHPVAAIGEAQHVAEGVRPQLSVGQGRLDLELDKLRLEKESVAAQPGQGLVGPGILTQEQRAADTELVDPVRQTTIAEQR